MNSIWGVLLSDSCYNSGEVREMGYGNYQYPYNYQRNNLEWIMVPSVDDVEKVQVQPNSKAWIMVQNEAVFALRSADQMGLVTTDMYSFAKYEKKEEPKPDYVTKSELEAIVKATIEKLGGAKRESTNQQHGQQR